MTSPSCFVCALLCVPIGGLLGACVPLGPAGYEHAAVDGIKVVADTEAARVGLTSEPFALPIAAGTDGTEAVIAYLQAARARGAVAVSTLVIEVATPIDGRAGLCRTWVGPDEEVRRRSRVVSTPGRYEGQMVYKPVTKFVTENVYRCKPVSQYVTRYETTYESSYDYISKSYRSRPVSRPVSRYETKTQCGYESQSHLVTRYEYQWESRWIPPRWDVISEQYSTWKLVESEPVCAPVATPGADGTPADGATIHGLLHRDPSR